MTQSPTANENGSPRSSPRSRLRSSPRNMLEVQTAPLLFPPSSPRRSPVSQSSANANSKLKRLAPVIFLTAFIVSAVDNLRLRSDGNYSQSSATDRIPRSNGQATRRAYSILPRTIYSVIGLESSGTQFVSKIIEDALATNSQYNYKGPYREGSAPCIEMCTDESDECLVKKSIAEGHECVETNDVQVQHFSLPWGGSCQEHPNPPVVDVVLPPQCTRNQTNLTEKKECSAMAKDIWGLQLNGTAMKYPTRYQLDIVKSKEWYDAQGVEQVFVIVVRDDKISFAARSSSHCTDTELRQREEDVGMQIIINAINKYILKDDKAEALSQETLQHWAAKQYQGEGGMRRRLSAIPSNDGVVVVSYESLVKLGPAYVRMMYQALGIVSDFMPDVKDSNAKYLKDSKTQEQGLREYLPDGRWLFANDTQGAFDTRHGVLQDAGHLRHEHVANYTIGDIESCSMKEGVPRSKHIALSSAASVRWEEGLSTGGSPAAPRWAVQNERTGNSTLDRITLMVNGTKAFFVDAMGAEDPRMVTWRGRPLVLYHSVLRGRQMWLYDHRTRTQTMLTICGHGTQRTEKNWSPLVVSDGDDDLYLLLVYSIDPLVILRYDVEVGDGVCTLVYGHLPLTSMPRGKGPYGGTPFKEVTASGSSATARSYISLAHSREKTGNDGISPERQLGGAVYRPVPVVLHGSCQSGVEHLDSCTFSVDQYEPWLEVQSSREVFESPWRKNRGAGAVNGSVSYPYDIHVFPDDGLVRVGVEYEDCMSVYEDYRIEFGPIESQRRHRMEAIHQRATAGKCPRRVRYASRSKASVVSVMEKEEALANEVEGEIWVVSHGGVSSERLRGHIDRIDAARGMPSNHTKLTSGKKHRPMQGVLAHFPYPLRSNQPRKGPRLCIYVFGSAYESLLSQLRRHIDNPAKLHNDESFPKFGSVEALLNHPDPEPFGLLNQFENFLSANVTYPVLLVRYDALNDLAALRRLDEAVAELTGYSYNFTALRTEGYVRNSTLDALSDTLRERFVGRYARIQEMFDRQPLIRLLAPSMKVVESRGLDFAVVGFPKTGTTFLLDVLERHPEVVMPPPKAPAGAGSREFCDIHQDDGDELAMAWLRSATSTAATRSGLPKKYGIKCPTVLRSALGIDNLVKISADTRLVVGVRHPVLWFQSFFNFRVWEHYAYVRNETIPNPIELNGTKDWHYVATASARFDLYLQQLDKVSLDPAELKEMVNADQLWPKRIAKNPFKAFIYSAEQLSDKDSTRQSQFQRDLQGFLGLETPLLNFDEVPKSNVHDSTPYPEHIDICEPRHRALRDQLVQQGRRSSRWILEKFVKSPDVMVSDADHFSSILSTWGEDPCKQ